VQTVNARVDREQGESTSSARSVRRGVPRTPPPGWSIQMRSSTKRPPWSGGSGTRCDEKPCSPGCAKGRGDDDGLCESNETCEFAPNIGGYQGHGPLVSAGTLVAGQLTGITLLRRQTNGY
jgi:hypothetical protein